MTENTAQGASAPDINETCRELEQHRDNLRNALTGAVCIQFLITSNVSQYYGATGNELVNTGLPDALSVLLKSAEHHFGKLSNVIDDLGGL